MWTRLAGASQWFCEPQWQSKAKNRQGVSALEQIPDESSNKPAKPDTRGAAQKESEAKLFGALLANRLYMARKQSVLEEQTSSLQSSLDETRHMLNHSQRVCEEFKAQLKEKKRERKARGKYERTARLAKS